MSLRNFFLKRIKKHKSFDDLNVFIETDLEFAEEQKEVIKSIVRRGCEEGKKLHDMAISISMFMSCRVSVNVAKVHDGIRVRIF